MDAGVRERAEARLRALFDEDPAAHAAMLLSAGERSGFTVRELYEWIAALPDERWAAGVGYAKQAVMCRCRDCNLSPEPALWSSHKGIA